MNSTSTQSTEQRTAEPFSTDAWARRLMDTARRGYLTDQESRRFEGEARGHIRDSTIRIILHSAAREQDEELHKHELRKPPLRIDADGLAAAQDIARWETRLNLTMDRIETRFTGVDDGARPTEWVTCCGTPRNLMLGDLQDVANMDDGRTVRPWRIRSKGHTDELLAVVAARNPVAGPGSAVFHAACEYLDGLGARGALRIADVAAAADCLQGYEVGNRVPRDVSDDIKRAFRAKGWREQTTRVINGEPLRRWVGPNGAINGEPLRRWVGPNGASAPVSTASVVS